MGRASPVPDLQTYVTEMTKELATNIKSEIREVISKVEDVLENTDSDRDNSFFYDRNGKLLVAIWSNLENSVFWNNGRMALALWVKLAVNVFVCKTRIFIKHFQTHNFLVFL